MAIVVLRLPVVLIVLISSAAWPLGCVMSSFFGAFSQML